MAAQTSQELKEESWNLLSRTKVSFEYQEDEGAHTRLLRHYQAYKREKRAGKHASDKTLFEVS